MSRTLRVTRALVLLLALSACSSVQVKQDWDPQANFAALHRWSWQSSTPVVTGNPRLDDPLVHKRIQGALADTLRTKGYAQTTSKPDFLVTYHIAIEQKLDAQTIYTGYGPYRGWYGVGGTQTVVEQYDLGTLLVDFIDPNTNNNNDSVTVTLVRDTDGENRGFLGNVILDPNYLRRGLR